MNESVLLLTAREVANLLRISLRTLWRLKSAGRLPEPVRLGAALRWRVTDLQAFLAAGCQVAAPGDNSPRR